MAPGRRRTSAGATLKDWEGTAPPPMPLPHTPPPPPRRPPPRSVSRLSGRAPPPSSWSPYPRSVMGEGEGGGGGAGVTAPPPPPPPGLSYDPSLPQSCFRQSFQVLGKVGGGSCGEVFKVRSRADGRLYALKRSRRRFRGPTDRGRLLEEVTHMQRVGQHPHILPLLWGWEQRGRLYLLTHFCPWGSLGELWGRLGGQGMGEWRLWGYLWDLLLALRHLHACPIAHLDLKPANILLTHSGCRLADFGTAVAPRLPHSNPQLLHIDPWLTQSDPRLTCTAPQLTCSDPQLTHGTTGDPELTDSDPQLPRTASQPTYIAPQLSHGDSQPPHIAPQPNNNAPQPLHSTPQPPHTFQPHTYGAGDPRYAAPEALMGQGGPPSDIFSLALTILELGGSQRLPPWGEGWQELRRGGLPQSAAPGLSEELRGVLGAMMEPDPARRPTAAELLTWGAVRRAGRWRVLTRWADVGLRGMEALGEAFRLALWQLWGTLWGTLWGPATPPSSPPPHTPHSSSEEEEEDKDSRRSPSPMVGLRRALTFEEEEEELPHVPT